MLKNRIVVSVVSILILISLAFTNYSPSYAADPARAVKSDPAQPAVKTPAFVPGVVLVGFKPGVTVEQKAQAWSANSAALGAALRSVQAQSMRPVFSQGKSAASAQIYRLRLPANANIVDAVKVLSADPGVAFAEPDYIAFASEDTPTPTSTLGASPTETMTETPTSIDTPTPSPTGTMTETPVPADTPTPTETSTETPIPAATNTKTSSPSPTGTMTGTMTPTVTATPTITKTPTITPTLFFNDPLYGQQWGLAKINTEGAWDYTYGSSTIVIAVIDSGMDLTHPDLAAHLWTNPGEIASNGIDDDSNGLIDDVHGWNFISANNDVADDNGHGTLVSGVAAAIAGNGQGIAGVCPQCRIMPVKVMSLGGTANYSDMAVGVLYAAQKGAKVINLSLGGYANSIALRNAIDTAINTYGALVVAGAGNDNTSNLFYPAAYDNVLAVAGTQNDDSKVGTSNYAAWVDVSAPGINILTTALGGDWENNAGTSFAAPFASGLAGLLRSLHPTWSANLTRAQIVNTTDDIDGANPGYTGKLGSGRINAQKAMSMAATPQLSIASYTVNGVTSGAPAPGSSVNLIVTIKNTWGTVTSAFGTLSTSDPYVTISGASASFGNVDAYAAAANAAPFVFLVSASAPYGRAMAFSLTVNAANGVHQVFPLTITTQSNTVNISGPLSSDTTWTNDKTYHVVDNVMVSGSATLTIQPGTLVKFAAGKSLLIDGALIANGAPNQIIVFTSDKASPMPGDWNLLKFTSTALGATLGVNDEYLGGSILQYARVEYANGVALMETMPYISNVTFYKNVGTHDGESYWYQASGALWRRAYDRRPGRMIVRDSSFLENEGSGFQTYQPYGSAEYLITNNRFINNIYAALMLVVGNERIDITSNTFSGNGGGMSLEYVGDVAGNTLVQDNVIMASTRGAYFPGYGISMGSGRPIIRHNLFANHDSAGQTCEESCAVIAVQDHASPQIISNSFVNNHIDTLICFNCRYGFNSTTPESFSNNNWANNTVNYVITRGVTSNHDLNATGNYWGTTNTAQINSLIFDHNDDGNPGYVLFDPVLTAPAPSAPAYLWQTTITPDPAGIEPVTFTLTFSAPMDQSANPLVTFGATAPYSAYTVLENAQWVSDTVWRGTFNITSLVPRGKHTLSVSGAKGAGGMTIPTDTRAGFLVDYAGSITDKTPPTKPLVTASGSTSLTTLSASWSSSDAESPITLYRYAIGSTPGGRDVVDWTYTTNKSMTRNNLNLTFGLPYYVSVGARNQGGLWSQNGISNMVKAGILPSTRTYFSNKLEDGWVLEKSENSNTGGTLNNSAATFNLGDDVTKKQYRGLLSFSTGATLPDNAIITSVTLKVKKSAVLGGGNPVATFQGFMVDVKNGFFGAAALQAADFQTAPSASYGPFNTALVGGWYSINLTGAGAFVNKLAGGSGLTQIRLRFKLGDNNNAIANVLSLYSGNAPAASRPQLVISYYVP